MIEQTIDFGNFSKKIIVNPIVPLQLLNLKCRNAARIQATLLGKIYSSHIQILEIVPVGLCDENKIKTIDFQQHQRGLENMMNVYPTLQIIGVAVTDLKPDISLAILHTMYVNKQSGFKAQGILSFPIILSVSTKISPSNKNFHIEAFSYNQTYKFCKDVMEVTAFQKLDASIGFGDADFQSMTPLFEAVNDQEKVVPVGNVDALLKELVNRLKQLKIRCDGEESLSLKVKLREVVDRLNSKHEYSMEELSYLLDLTGLQKRIALKLNKFL